QHKGGSDSWWTSVTSTTLLLRLGGALKTHTAIVPGLGLQARPADDDEQAALAAPRMVRQAPRTRPNWRGMGVQPASSGGVLSLGTITSGNGASTRFCRPPPETCRPDCAARERGAAGGAPAATFNEAPFILPGDGLSSSSSFKKSLRGEPVH